jgi:hypothetical protein
MLNSGYWQIAQHFGAISKYLIKNTICKGTTFMLHNLIIPSQFFIETIPLKLPHA